MVSLLPALRFLWFPVLWFMLLLQDSCKQNIRMHYSCKGGLWNMVETCKGELWNTHAREDLCAHRDITSLDGAG